MATYITYGVGYCFIHSKGSAKTLQAMHLHANRMLISALISKDKFFEAKSLLLDMKAQDYDTEFVEEKLAEVEEKMNGQKTE